LNEIRTFDSKEMAQKHPDFVVNNNSESLKQALMDSMFTNASNAFLQRSTFFDKRSLEII
jgi:hypothetical protein